MVVCSSCNRDLSRSSFSSSQLKKKESMRKCSHCCSGDSINFAGQGSVRCPSCRTSFPHKSSDPDRSLCGKCSKEFCGVRCLSRHECESGSDIERVPVVVIPVGSRHRQEMMPKDPMLAKKWLCEVMECDMDSLELHRVAIRSFPFQDVFNIGVFVDSNGYQANKHTNARASIMLTELPDGPVKTPYFQEDGPNVRARGTTVAVSLAGCFWTKETPKAAIDEMLKLDPSIIARFREPFAPGETKHRVWAQFGRVPKDAPFFAPPRGPTPLTLEAFDLRWGLQLHVPMAPGAPPGNGLGILWPDTPKFQDEMVQMMQMMQALRAR